MKFEAVKGSRLTDTDAGVIGPILSDLAGGGVVSAAQVVGVAKDPSNPLHHFFTWDDSIAAHEYRLSQARYMLRSVIVRTDEGEGSRPPRLTAVVVTDAGDRGYATMATITASESLMVQVLAQAKRDLEAWYHKYQQLSELAEMRGVFGEIRRVVSEPTAAE